MLYIQENYPYLIFKVVSLLSKSFYVRHSKSLKKIERSEASKGYDQDTWKR